MSVFTGASECLDHLGLVKVAMEAVELVQPEVVTLKVECCLWWIVWVSSQIAEVLHQRVCFCADNHRRCSARASLASVVVGAKANSLMAAVRSLFDGVTTAFVK